jgi:hypothetical protein
VDNNGEQIERLSAPTALREHVIDGPTQSCAVYINPHGISKAYAQGRTFQVGDDEMRPGENPCLLL